MPINGLDGEPTPQPVSYFSSRTPKWRRALARVVAAGNRVLHRTPPCRWLYRWQLWRQLEFSTVSLPVGRESQELIGARFVFLSDLHIGSYLTGTELIALFDRIAELQPDAILLGGDLVHTLPREIDAYPPALERVAPPFGVFAVPGNHEYYPGLDIERWSDVLGAAGVEVLMNRGVRLVRGTASLWLAGVDDMTEGRPDVVNAMTGRQPDEPAVLLSHHPDLFPTAAQHGVGLTLSGHTHGGQLSPFDLVLLKHSDLGYHRGEFELGNSRLKVGRGIGAAIVPLRYRARPEVVVVELCATGV